MDFLELGFSGVESWICAGADDLTTDEMDDIFRGRVKPKDPLEMTILEGKRFPDLLSAKLFMMAVSPRMLDILQDTSATGFTTHSLTLRHPVLGYTVHGYSLLIVHGRGGPLDEAKMQPIKRYQEAILNCNGFHIFEDKWDGSDVFTIDDLGFSVWVTERVARALKKCKPKLRHLNLTPNTHPYPYVPPNIKKHLPK